MSRSGPRRRTVLLAGGLAAVGAVGLLAASERRGTVPVIAAPPPTPGGTDAAAVRAEALAHAGLRFERSPWQDHVPGHDGPWSAVFASWLLRGLDVPPASSPAALHAVFAAAGRTGDAAAPGALVFYTYDAPGSVHHVGFVESVRGAAVGTVEGDVPGGLDHRHTFVRRFGVPWDPRVVYGYPDYAGVTSTT